MGKCLGKISKMLTTWTEFFRVKSEMIGVTDRLFEKEARLLKITGAREAFHKPERTHIERPFLAREAIGSRIADVIPIDKRIFHQRILDHSQSREPARIRRAAEFH